MNRSIVMIKPHAYKENPKFVSEAKQHLEASGCAIGETKVVKATLEMIDRHYEEISRIALSEKDFMHEKRPVLSYLQYKKTYDHLTNLEILKKWRFGDPFKLCDNTYIARMDTGELVANGFYGFMREEYDNALVYVMEVLFDCPWSHFKEHIIGTTDASRCSPETLRGKFFLQYPHLVTDYSRNGVHASTNDEEAAREWHIWFT